MGHLEGEGGPARLHLVPHNARLAALEKDSEGQVRGEATLLARRVIALGKPLEKARVQSRDRWNGSRLDPESDPALAVGEEAEA